MSTLRVVAAAAGVHVATAAAVLNSPRGNTRVSDSTRKKVLAAARKHSYVRNELARRLRTGRSNVVGFLGGDMRNPFFAELTAALEAALARFGLQLMVSHVTQAEPAAIKRAIGSMRQENVRTIVCWEESARSRQTGAALLSIGFTRRERPGVWLDLERAIQLAVGELTQRGFRHLGFYFPTVQKESPSVAARAETFVRVCRNLALVPPQLTSYAGESWDLLASIQGAKHLSKNYPAVEAWVGFNDIAGLGLLRCLPAQWARRVLCFDGTFLARSWPRRPAHLDLGIAEFADAVARVVSGELDGNEMGRRENWLQPTFSG